jgi:hypothetical protein
MKKCAREKKRERERERERGGRARLLEKEAPSVSHNDITRR